MALPSYFLLSSARAAHFPSLSEPFLPPKSLLLDCSPLISLRRSGRPGQRNNGFGLRSRRERDSMVLGSGRHGLSRVFCLPGGSEAERDPCSEGEGEEEQVGVVNEEEMVASIAPERWDVLGLGQAMVDFSGMVDDELLKRLGIEKGTRKVVNHEERGRVLRAMDGCCYKAAAGGSLSNTLVALARLGRWSVSGPVLNVAMAGSVGGDPLGGFYSNANTLLSFYKESPPPFPKYPSDIEEKGTSSTVDYDPYLASIISKTNALVIEGYLFELPHTIETILKACEDARRNGVLIAVTASDGTSSTVDYDPYLASIISKTNALVIEGYLFELPHTIETILKACEDARRNGVLIAVTASDVSCIERCYDDFWEVIGNFADIVFANSNEARAFCDLSSKDSPMSAARYLSHFVPLVSVTDGPRGILYGILRGASDLKGMGMLASQVAAVVVGQQGTRLRVQDACRLTESFAFHLDSSKVCSDVGSDHISSF
ncbi:putative sugar kinase slr0537 [Cocos nucifera]|uniref:Putative sugar kinase slr0537 n=1 Tax=Cocos nucifera TaxID=13894 RepID=A0A8K0IEJ7_COCNU|nr:putative sugar kinase slr0537 [Cocos nucifera]